MKNSTVYTQLTKSGYFLKSFILDKEEFFTADRLEEIFCKKEHSISNVNMCRQGEDNETIVFSFTYEDLDGDFITIVYITE